MAETAVVRELRASYWPEAETRRLKGSEDWGDVTGTPGLCWEVKYGNGGFRMSEWLRQTAVETRNCGAEHGILVIKPKGVGVKNTARWLAVMSEPDHDRLLALAPGYVLVERPAWIQAEQLGFWLQEARKMPGGGVRLRPLSALTVRRSSALGVPQDSYRVMFLQDMIFLLAKAGYGQI